MPFELMCEELVRTIRELGIGHLPFSCFAAREGYENAVNYR